MIEITTATSPETAYLVNDYPYGFTLRTEIRYWIETKRGHGQRVMSQTRNPKRAGAPWNAPKGSTYNPIKALYLNEQNNHVENDGISAYANESELDAFIAKFPATCAIERNARVLEYLRAGCRAQARVSWTVTNDDGRPQQTAEEQAAIMRTATAIELHHMRNGEKE